MHPNFSVLLHQQNNTYNNDATLISSQGQSDYLGWNALWKCSIFWIANYVYSANGADTPRGSSLMCVGEQNFSRKHETSIWPFDTYYETLLL